MKKFISFLVLLSLFFFISFFVTAAIHGPNECCKLDHTIPGCGSQGDIIGPPTPPGPKWCDVDGDGIMDASTYKSNWATCCFLDSIYTTSDWLIRIFMASSLIVFAFAGYLFLSSGGDTGKVEQAKTFILYGIIGLFLVLLSRVIPAIIKAIVL